MNSAAEEFDLVVVGGGIQGVGVLQAAAAAGWRAALVEERALASGTSSRSSKLIHGGLRYLESRQFALVRESLAERRTLLEIAPGLVQLVPFHIPIYRHTRRRPWLVRGGLSLYALLGDLEPAARFERLPRREWDTLDGLATDGLEAVFRYHDGQTDDAALVRAVARSAEELGGRIACPARFVRARRTGAGYEIELAQEGKSSAWRASALINATGPWINTVRERIDPVPPGLEIDLVAGTHLELEGRLERGIYYTEAPRDGRAVFFMPWKNRVLVGTTETNYRGDPRVVQPLPEEIGYLQETLSAYFPHASGKLLDSWAGLRVLPHSEDTAFHRRRETQLVCDDELHPRTIAIYGGKLTGYRATGSKVVALLRRTLPDVQRLADTATLRLPTGPLATITVAP
ncbi:MAG: FAD-dependent oxidoreductase [Planctomycetes bacterium]|nr:FAD-dependent oxidoreductase [Planctomycetota bacterium]